MGIARYLAAARSDDLAATVRLVDELVRGNDNGGAVYLLQVGSRSPMAIAVGRLLRRVGRRSVSLVIGDREMAQSDDLLSKVGRAGAVWLFADDMLEAFMTVFATELAWLLRGKSRAGLPVIGVGGGALSLGGLLLATRICHGSEYHLAGGLGWAPRTFLDANVVGLAPDPSIALTTVSGLPGLVGVQLGSAGAVRVQGGRFESVGSEPVVLLGTDGQGSPLVLSIEPGQVSTIAPPPFAPFERTLLPHATLNALHAEYASARPVSRLPRAPAPLRQAPPPESRASDVVHGPPAGGRACPMCKQRHGRPSLELVA